MKEFITKFLADHGFKFFISGFILALVGLVLFKLVKTSQPLVHAAGFYMVWTGIAAYIVGRIGVVLQNRRARKLRIEAAAPAEKDSL